MTYLSFKSQSETPEQIQNLNDKILTPELSTLVPFEMTFRRQELSGPRRQ